MPIHVNNDTGPAIGAAYVDNASPDSDTLASCLAAAHAAPRGRMLQPT
jgi:hypothetical protein